MLTPQRIRKAPTFRQQFVVILTSCSLAIALTACPKSVETVTAPEAPPAPATTPANESTADADSLKVGILSIDSAVSVNERYSPLIEYLETATDYDFELVALSQESQFTQVENQAIAFTSTNPLSAVQVRRLYDTEFLVTHSRPQTGTQFSGLIVVNAESGINSLEELKGKSGSCVNFQTAAAGCAFQMYHLIQMGIDPYQDFASFTENKSQDNIVLGVLNGALDFGFIRTGQLEKMERKGLISSKEELKILEPMADDFFYSHTTALYPEWPIAALSHVESAVAETVKQALLEIPPEHPALQAIGIETFVPAVDYDPLNPLIETLKLKTWDVDTTPEP